MINGRRWIVELFIALIVSAAFWLATYTVNHYDIKPPLTKTTPASGSVMVAVSPSPTIVPSTSTSTSPGMVFLEGVEYNPVTNCVTGKIIGTENPGAYRVIVLIQTTDSDRNMYVKPSEANALRPVQPNGTFNVEAFTYGDIHEPGDRAAKYYYVFLVPADVEYGRDIKDYATNEGIPLCFAVKNLAVDYIWMKETGNP